MKKLSLLMFAILILGCDTEKSVVEEPPPIVEPRPPVVMQEEPIGTPQIAAATVLDGHVDVDPEPLNRHGIVFKSLGNLKMYTADLWGADVGAHHWSPRDVIDHRGIGKKIHLMPMADSPLLGYDAEYEVTIYAQDLACNGAWRSIKFRTKPR
jgi:hypothetical protein